jgi:hypothetical protein
MYYNYNTTLYIQRAIATVGTVRYCTAVVWCSAGMAGLDKEEIFCPLAKTLPIATDVARFLSTQNVGS